MPFNPIIHGKIGPFSVGSRKPDWVVTYQFKDNTALNLTGATFAGVLYRKAAEFRKDTAGTYAITTAASGIFTYTVAAADVDAPGDWIWETTITISALAYEPVRIEFHLDPAL